MKCPLCNNINTENVFFEANYFFATGKKVLDFSLELCRDCNFLFQSSAYSEEYNSIIATIYKGFYKNEKFKFPNRSDENLHALEMIVSNFFQTQNANILEIGSNRGDLLYLLQEKMPNTNVLGVEPTKFNNLIVPTISGFFSKDLFSNKFDVIVMQHVLEHIKDPKNMVDDIFDLLNVDGLLYIEVPYINKSLENGIEDFSLEHINYFNMFSLSKLLNKFEIVDHNRENFLRIIAKKSLEKKTVNYFDDNYDIKSGMQKLINKKKEISNEIEQYSKNGKTIVFYGVSYYYLILYKELYNVIDIKNTCYFDDNYREKYEKEFKLPLLDNFNDNCVVILSSNNFNVQSIMEQKIRNINGIIIVKPWSEIKEIP